MFFFDLYLSFLIVLIFYKGFKKSFGPIKFTPQSAHAHPTDKLKVNLMFHAVLFSLNYIFLKMNVLMSS